MFCIKRQNVYRHESTHVGSVISQQHSASAGFVFGQSAPATKELQQQVISFGSVQVPAGGLVGWLVGGVGMIAIGEIHEIKLEKVWEII